ncbi:hypothetical protein KSP39_PZI008473 [Platanthera zijinensis]|uniref:Uncharacterized protein n=1 Tax=Platanthera zijinensis TaxID=2320716 RepID=A0AAP0G943_9ASPA
MRSPCTPSSPSSGSVAMFAAGIIWGFSWSVTIVGGLGREVVGVRESWSEILLWKRNADISGLSSYHAGFSFYAIPPHSHAPFFLPTASDGQRRSLSLPTAISLANFEVALHPDGPFLPSDANLSRTPEISPSRKSMGTFPPDGGVSLPRQTPMLHGSVHAVVVNLVLEIESFIKHRMPESCGESFSF